MKKYIKSFALPMIAMAGLFTSCELTEYNPSAGDASLSSYQTWKGLQAFSYNALSEQLYSSYSWLVVAETGTDLWVSAGNADAWQQMLNYESFTPDYACTKELFKQANSMITNCNTVIDQASSVSGGNADDIAILVAETKTLRAFYNYLLVANFGPVTLNLEPSAALTGNIALYPKRNSEKDFYDQIEKDLKEAIPVLPVTPFENNRARVTKKSAIGLLARAYAQRAGLGNKYGDADKYWKLAAETAEDLIANAGTYGAYLYNDIADMWADANNRDNKEALFVAPGSDAFKEAYAYAPHNNLLLGYTTGGFYSEFFVNGHKPSDKGYFYGRQNSQLWQPSRYLMYCFNPKWDRRWEYSFGYAWNEYSMEQPGWVPRSSSLVTITEELCTKYGIDKSHVGETLYPYADCGATATTNGGGNQYAASIWPKGYTGNETSKLLKVAPSAAVMNQEGYAGTTKAYAIPYPIALDDNRFNTVYVHEPLSAEDKAKCPYVVVVLDDLYGSNQLPYGNTAKGSDAGNPPAIGNGETNAKSGPALIKFNWSYDGCFVGNNLQRKTGDVFIMRMAEAYLIAAEAEQMLGNNTKAMDYLNTLRQRAARQNVNESEWKLTSVDEDVIFDEYARELCGEFSRWLLLKRHNAFESRLGKYNVRAAQAFKPYMYNRPVSADFLSTILNANEYGDNGYGQTPTSGLENVDTDVTE
ncbi:RagB/SusD family nutrient uptake outer membrane protein [uncultured Duncaniella sp.]|uniref:RagB/SusD family nutrient uptake outer membrane protein n=1 Tax=uncultured Duncaniella sp. TaxID=2768039 RepID=UPI0025FDDFF5|nr:RagB/SusD family nutrient uptake outer membrane protein [uncultured Duncaniella sp.]